MNITNVLTEVARKLNQKGIPYVVGGSVATAINGCVSIKPNDIDVILKNSIDVEKVVHMFEYFLPESEAIEKTDITNWISTKSRPAINFEDSFKNVWTFARFLINDIKIEIANISPISDYKYVPETGIWESGPTIWPYIKQVTIEGTAIPVLPLEIQLETNMNRELEDRIENIVDVFRREGYDSDLLKFSLSKKNYQKIKGIV